MEEQDVDTDLESENSDDVEEVSEILDQLDQINQKLSSLTEQQSELAHKISRNSNRIDKVSETIGDVKDKIQKKESEIDIQESQIKNINKSLDALEKDLESTKGETNTQYKSLKKRLSALENMMDVSERDIARAIKPNASELEQLTVIPEESRNNQFTVRVRRAIALYENFHEISEPVKSGGERVLSKDIKTFLNGYADHEIKYTQVQRVIDSFDEKTGSSYSVQSTSNGRAIVWNPD